MNILNQNREQRGHMSSCHTSYFPILILLLLALGFSGCATLPRNPVPKEKISKAEVVDLPEIRSWADEFSPEMQKDIINSVIQEIDYESKNPDQPIHTSALALSGGGSY